MNTIRTGEDDQSHSPSRSCSNARSTREISFSADFDNRHSRNDRGEVLELLHHARRLMSRACHQRTLTE